MSVAAVARAIVVCGAVVSVVGACSAAAVEGREAVAIDAGDPPKPRVYDDTGASSTDGLVETRRASELGLTGLTLSGRANPKGKPARWYFEYGPTTAYGSKTPEQPFPTKLAAHYRESWSDNLANWAGGFSGTDLVYVPNGGSAGGGVRFDEPSAVDQNHVDGIGPNQLCEYTWVGSYVPGAIEPAYWGGGDPDLRDAKVSVSVKGERWKAEGSELVFWMQADLDLAKQQNDNQALRANWAYTGFYLTDALFSGQWQRVEYRLANDPSNWTYAGTSVDAERRRYVYQPLDQTLGHMNNDVFHMLVFVSPLVQPTGAIDFDELEVTYRNKSVVYPGNGGRLVSSPPGSDDPAPLVDGWRNGDGHVWRSAANPTAPQEIVYELANPVTIETIQIHNHPDWPSKEISVEVSADGTTWTTLAGDASRPAVLRASSPAGPNYAFYLDSQRVRTREGKTSPAFPVVQAKRVRVKILSGYKAEYWGLGEIELFGTGAKDTETDDDFHSLNADVSGLPVGQPVHYRLVMVTADGVTYGGDKTFDMPKEGAPVVYTRGASRLGGGSAKLEGRVGPLGFRTTYYFAYHADGDTKTMRTEDADAGIELGPRTVVSTITGLVPGKTYRYALVASSEKGTSFGEELSFVAR